jgi:hypothetical protein
MSEKKSISDELTSGLGSILSRLGEFFHIFDLSYIIAGAITFSALIFLYVKLGLAFPFWFSFRKWESIAIIIVACYVFGLFAYAFGRFLSDKFRKKSFKKIMKKALEDHALNEVELIQYYMNDRHEALYRLMWCEMANDITNNKSSQQYFQNLIRYWSMSATYDGVAFAFLVWAIVLFCFPFYDKTYNLSISHAFTFGIFSIVAGLISFHRGFIYFEIQIKDIVAYYAMKYWPLTPYEEKNTP